MASVTVSVQPRDGPLHQLQRPFAAARVAVCDGALHAVGGAERRDFREQVGAVGRKAVDRHQHRQAELLKVGDVALQVHQPGAQRGQIKRPFLVTRAPSAQRAGAGNEHRQRRLQPRAGRAES
jgi:hypothetical protein